MILVKRAVGHGDNPRMSRTLPFPFVLLLGLASCRAEPAADVDATVAAFTRAWVESDHQRPFAATFLGIPAWQNPCAICCPENESLLGSESKLQGPVT